MEPIDSLVTTWTCAGPGAFLVAVGTIASASFGTALFFFSNRLEERTAALGRRDIEIADLKKQLEAARQSSVDTARRKTVWSAEAPRHADRSLLQYVSYYQTGNWDGVLDPSNSKAIADIQQWAFDGKLTIWAKLGSQPVHHAIDREYWRSCKIGMPQSDARSTARPPAGSYESPLFDLMVNEAQVRSLLSW